MKHIKRYTTVAVFVLTLTTASFAGQISTGVTSPPPPDSQAQAAITTADGEISTTAQAPDSIIEVALSLVQSVLSLF